MSSAVTPTTTASTPIDAATIAAATAAIRFLAAHGYENTTARELADAIGMSRSTFFRRFGSKEDVVFFDHELTLPELRRRLEHTKQSPSEVLSTGILEVMHRLIRDVEAARARSELLRHNPALRERELVMTHRYEQIIAEYLERARTPGTPDWAPIALSAGLVAVHNAALRRWLHHGEARVISGLERQIVELVARFSPWFGGDSHAATGGSRVVVAAFDSTASAEEVLKSVAEHLPKH